MATTYPTQGQQYTIQAGDTLSGIALTAYGNASRWPWLYNANRKNLRSGNPDLIYPGEILFVTPDPAKVQVLTQATQSAMAGNDPYSITLVLTGKDGTSMRVPVITGRLNRSIDTMVDSFIAEIPWTPGQNAQLDKLVAPFAYPGCQVYVGPTLCLTGRLYNVTTDKTEHGTTKTLECYSMTVDLVDSSCPPPYHFSSGTMQSIAQQIVAPFGLSATFLSGKGATFSAAQFPHITETAGKFLEKLAFESGQLVGNDVYGNIVFQTAALLESAGPVGTLDESQPWGTALKIDFCGRERFGVYNAMSWEDDAKAIFSTAKDAVVPATRWINFVVDNLDPGNAPINAAWKRSKQLIKCLTIPIPLMGWYGPKGALWAPGQMVTVNSATLACPNGFTFLAREVETVMDGNGYTSTLHLIPSQALTGEVIKEPWVLS